MTVNNDERVLQLQKLIESKKKELGKIGKFTSTTNNILDLDGQTINLNVLSKNGLTLLLIKLNALKMSAKELELECVVGGHSVEIWMEDVQGKLDILSKMDKQKELKKLEAVLEGMLSENKKIELQLDNIENLLKGN